MLLQSLLIILLAFALSGCGPLNRLVERLNPSATGKAPGETVSSRVTGDLMITPQPERATVEWGDTTRIVLDIAWADSRVQPVQLTPAADTPGWLKIELMPSLIQPPARAEVLVSAVPGEARCGEQTLIVEATARDRSPVAVEIPLSVHRQSGEFIPLQPGYQNLQCRGICGRFSNGSVTFYFLGADEGEECDTSKAADESRRIGFRSFGVSRRGYGYGRTCTVAALFEQDNSLTFVNLGLNGKIPLGEVLVTLPGVERCWFSKDNTVALAVSGSRLQPFDLITGRSLGEACYSSGTLAPIRLDGNRLTAGSCEWILP